MKFIRFISTRDEIVTGICNGETSIDIIEGSPLTEYRRTGKQCRFIDIKEYLPTVDIPAIIALGGNYAEHARECKEGVPDKPLVFLKAVTSLTGHKSHIVLPKHASTEVDYEAELGVIIKRKAKHITAEQASEYILGYTCVNDVSARDCQIKLDKQWARGKSFDTFCPVGPVIETELNPDNVGITLLLNGQCMQDDSTTHMVYPVYDIVSYLSQNMTLLPGTLILTGTPSGVGFARVPQVFLKNGDTVSVSIDGIGCLENTVTSE